MQNPLSLHMGGLQRAIHKIRVENACGQKFVPENELYEILTPQAVSDIVFHSVPSHNPDQLVNSIIQNARKIFGILILINQVGCIHQFIERDQYQKRPMDDLLPIPKIYLRDILGDDYIADLFYEKQWEVSVPVFSDYIISRELAPQTILPYLREEYLASGAYGNVYQIDIHPAYRPSNSNVTKFVRKELDSVDVTYKNELRVLSTLQRLKHPNILQLIGCYTLNSKHNLISPFISGGTLQKYLEQQKPTAADKTRLFASLAGLASAIWALHDFLPGDTSITQKGHHQDLRPDNILVEGERFILADFGLSSIKHLEERSETAFKGRKGYCQAPECAELRRPFREFKITRASDIYALGCIATDLLTHLIYGPGGVKEFREARGFQMPPTRYYFFHKEDRKNDVVGTWLDKARDRDQSPSMTTIVELIRKMLLISPDQRPSAANTTANLYIATFTAFSEELQTLFAKFTSSPDAQIAQAMFQGWMGSQDIELYANSLGATATAKVFDDTVTILRQLVEALNRLDPDSPNLDNRSFLEARALISQLLNMLSPERRSRSRSHLNSMIYKVVQPAGSPDATNDGMRQAIGDSPVREIEETKHLVAQVNGEEDKLNPNKQTMPMFTGSIKYIRTIGKYKIARIPDEKSRNNRQRKLVIVETMHYQDPLQKRRLLSRLQALRDLLSNPNLVQQLRVPPFIGVRDNTDVSFEMLYGFPEEHVAHDLQVAPISLIDLLGDREESKFPSLERRLRLGSQLAELLAAFHDIDWFHKNLTSSNIVFFSSVESPLSARTGQPYLFGFKHSRSTYDDFTEGPLQDRRLQRYHHPDYVREVEQQFTRFCPQFEYYSLGILLLEIGFWASVDSIMSEHRSASNKDFSEVLIKKKVPMLAFKMGSQFAECVKECLEGSNILTTLSFREKIITPLQKLDRSYRFIGDDQTHKNKRKRDETEDHQPRHKSFPNHAGIMK
ncbi:hypothetical protein H072_9063 [Dactylellina haptotyla CBS 200.50]|uniref:Protein kinase domain-containing protein n=1 Tax=Dactylellina haptotyla (strain CBS 200.50) TaxID=1284197 RepID=S8A2M5_DACHA|nr:hypothetical protein H072_9063 [Dactylellina haptotyla CBS 200.50]